MIVLKRIPIVPHTAPNIKPEKQTKRVRPIRTLCEFASLLCSADRIGVNHKAIAGRQSIVGARIPGAELTDRDAIAPGDGGEGVALCGCINNVVTGHDEAAPGILRPGCAA